MTRLEDGSAGAPATGRTSVDLHPPSEPSPSSSRPRPRFRMRLDLPAIVLAALIFTFAIIHFQAWLRHPGHPVGLGLVLLELVQGGLFIFRRRDRDTRRPLSAWLATPVGSWGLLLARPSGSGYFHLHSTWLFGAPALFGWGSVWLALQLVGTVLAILSLSSLGRSFGLLAGNRGVRTGGAYRIVRHPAYASYLIADIAYILDSFSPWNCVVLTLAAAAQLWRIQQEEATLSRDASYRAYRERVRYRLLPGIF